jgi:hypothetical protein
MTVFVDKMLLELSDPAAVEDLVAPAADPNREILKALFASVYELPEGALHSVKDVSVADAEFERPLFPPHQTLGTWTQTIPTHTRTDLVLEASNGLVPSWIDCVISLDVTVVVDLDPMEVESILAGSIDDFTTLTEFTAKFQFLDLAEFMAEHGITTVAELKAAFNYLIAEIKAKTPAPFDPNDPANERRFRLKLAILVRDAIDVAASMRDVKLALAALDRTLSHHHQVHEAEVRIPYSPVLIFPRTAVSPGTITAAALRDFFAVERILVLLTNP